MSRLRINRSKTKICLINNTHNNDFVFNTLDFTIVEGLKMLVIIFNLKLQNMQYNLTQVNNEWSES